MDVKIGLGSSLLESMGKLPKKIEKKVRELLKKYERDPQNSGIHFEQLPGMRDSKLRSLRVDQAYRMIMVQPPRGNVMLAVWVDHHDDAYRWAETKQFEVNPKTGVLQYFSVEQGEAAVASAVATLPAEPKAPEASRLFESIDEEDLLFAGVPQPLLNAVQDLKSDSELEALAPFLPQDASDILFLLASGYSLERAFEEASRPALPTSTVDTTDFEAALASPVSQGAFLVAEDEDELAAILDQPLEAWRLFLHPSQKKLVRSKPNGPTRVLGGAGTGKTVVLLHRASHLVREVFNGATDRVLVTTFTRNLALDLETTLATMCPEQIDRVDVKNLHAWARGYYERELGSKVTVLDKPNERRLFMEQATMAAAEEAFDVAFYMDEWEQVVQAHGIERKAAYLRVRRTGRGTRLSRQQREDVWSVMARYRELLGERGVVEWQDVVREATARLMKIENPAQLPYRAVLADEVQDFTAAELKLLRALAPPGPADLFLVGDAHQRIYGHMATLGSCGIEIRGRSKRLRINYRTTKQIRGRAVSVLENMEVDDLDGDVDTLMGYRSLTSGPEPAIHHCKSPNEEAELIVATVQGWITEIEPRDICLSARTTDQIQHYLQILSSAGISSVLVKGSAPTRAPGVRVATMHRMKGLEFKRVLLAGVQGGVVPYELPSSKFGDEASAVEHEQRERCLFYVAATRARDQLVITGFGRESSFFEG